MTVQMMKELFIRTLKEKNVVFDRFDDEIDERTVQLCYDGENVDLNVYVTFFKMDNGDMLASISCYNLPNFSMNLRSGYEVCNRVNGEGFTKFSIDEDGDVKATNSVVFSGSQILCEFSPEYVLYAASMLANDVNEYYPDFERAQ